VLMVALTRHTDQKGFLVRKRRITNIQEYLLYSATSLHLNFKTFYNNLLYCLNSDADTLETVFGSFQVLKITLVLIFPPFPDGIRKDGNSSSILFVLEQVICWKCWSLIVKLFKVN